MSAQSDAVPNNEDVGKAISRCIELGLFSLPVKTHTVYYGECQYVDPDTFEVRVDHKTRTFVIWDKDYPGSKPEMAFLGSSFTLNTGVEDALGILEKLIEALEDLRDRKARGSIVDAVRPEEEMMVGVLGYLVNHEYPTWTAMNNTLNQQRYLKVLEYGVCSITRKVFDDQNFCASLETLSLIAKVDRTKDLDVPTVLIGVFHPEEGDDAVFISSEIHPSHLTNYHVLGDKGTVYTTKVNLEHTLKETALRSVRKLTDFKSADSAHLLTLLNEKEDQGVDKRRRENVFAVHAVQVKADAVIPDQPQGKVHWMELMDIEVQHLDSRSNDLIRFLQMLCGGEDPNRVLMQVLHLKGTFK